MGTIHRGVVVLALLATAGCPSRTPKPAAPTVAAAGPEDRERVQALWKQRTAGGTRTEPCLGPGDLLEISVFRWQDLQGYRTRVSPAGTIVLPLLGALKAAGLTESELQEQIATGLRKGYMRDPQVHVFVAEYVSQQVSVTGAVARPGLIGLSRDHRTVSDMISEAGGFDEHAGGRILLYPVNRSACDGTVTKPPIQNVSDLEPITIDVNERYGAQSENPLVMPVVGGDAIVVDRGRFTVDGWVKTPGAYEIAPGMTALGGVSAAGGAVFAADMSRITVWRPQRGGTKKKIEVDMENVTEGGGKDVTLEAGDVIEVPASPIRIVPYGAYFILTTVVRVGASVPLF